MTVEEPKLEKKEKELDFLRFKSQFRLKLAWDNIIEKYSKDFEEETDEIDLETEKIVIDRGALRKSDPKVFGTVDNNPISPAKAKEAWNSPTVRNLFEEKGLIDYYDDGTFDLDEIIARKQREIEHDGYSSGSDIEDLQSPTRQTRYILPRYLHRPRIVRYPSVINLHRPMYGQIMYKRRIARLQQSAVWNAPEDLDEEYTSDSDSDGRQSPISDPVASEEKSREYSEDGKDEDSESNSELSDHTPVISPETFEEKDDLIHYPSDNDKAEVLAEIRTPHRSRLKSRKETSYSEGDKENWDPNQSLELKGKRDHLEENDWDLSRQRYPTSIYHTPKRIRVMPIPTYSAIRYASPRIHSYPTYSVPRYPIRYQIPVKMAAPEQARFNHDVSHSKESDEDELLTC
ncbi:hypothetical protein HDV06_003245 [Boothiomyces sp. JEL0866]|nr:hypothetical protein HDV06_003245 [Boothiomyces sp. JEL0866]